MPPKSGFQRTRNVGYDDDDIYDDDDYYEEETGDATSEDDKEQMRLGTISVREALGPAEAGVSDAQIHDALWHYYYDVGKSVSYLKNKLSPAPPKKETQPTKEKVTSRFEQAASAAVQKAPITAGKQSHAPSAAATVPSYPVAMSLPLPPLSMPPATGHDFFWDVPWGHVPAHRLGNITIDPPRHPVGLLGGSSKLAALAAKRRKEREEAQAAANASGEADAAVAMLDKLTMKSSSLTPTPVDTERSTRVSRYTARKRSPSPKAEEHTKEASPEPETWKSAVAVEFPAQRATASMFASTLCGTSPSAASSQNIPQEFPAPYSLYKEYREAKPFDGPSPDDIVRAAQANKGAGAGTGTGRH
jgi:elongation factor 1 alpha-like protein